MKRKSKSELEEERNAIREGGCMIGAIQKRGSKFYRTSNEKTKLKKLKSRCRRCMLGPLWIVEIFSTLCTNYLSLIDDAWISYEVIELTVCITNTFSNNFSNKDRWQEESANWEINWRIWESTAMQKYKLADRRYKNLCFSSMKSEIEFKDTSTVRLESV